MTTPHTPFEKPERRWLTLIAHTIFRFTRPMTLGVRGIVIDPQACVFLVRHTYVPGWHLPGGGVDAGETLEQALAKELSEEGHIRMTGRPKLHGLFFNAHVSRRDHVAVYVVRDFVQERPRAPDREIAEARFFPLTALPEGTTKGTRARLKEVFDGGAPSACW